MPLSPPRRIQKLDEDHRTDEQRIAERDKEERKRYTFRRGDKVRLAHGLSEDFIIKHIPEYAKLQRLLAGFDE